MFYKITLGLFIISSLSLNGFADSLDQSRKIISNTNTTLQTSQKHINSADTQSTQMFEQYKTAKKEIENYLVYNRQLSDIVTSQNEELQTLEKSIEGIEATSQKIMPFMEKMIVSLESFIASDYPFLKDERSTRVEILKSNMKRADLSISEKYRQILEAYQIEMDYGNTIEAYEGEVESKKVTFLKIGRIGLYYLSFDKTASWAWNQDKTKWQFLDDSDYKISIAKAIKIAKKQKSPDLFFAALQPARSRK